jgi:hypothetical protein
MTNDFLYSIRDQIVAAASYDEDGPFWETPYYDKASGQFLHREYHEIFNGGAGIALFFRSLYEYDKDEAHLKWAESITRRILKSQYCKQPRFYCFYTGISGIIYLSIKLYETTGKKEYLQSAMLLAKRHQHAIAHVAEMDLLSGAAGNMLVMTLLYHHTTDQEILAVIHQLLDRIIGNARIAQQGVKWDHKKMAYDSLAGFSHGAAGIAYALLQVGNYFQYEGLTRLAKLGFDYEMMYYDEQSGNWMDLRIGAHRYNLPGAHTWDLSVFRPSMKYVNSWAHGAAGIGLSHILFEQITGEGAYSHFIQASVKSGLAHVATHREDYTLCSGYGGMVTFLLQARPFYTDKPAINAAISDIAIHAAKLYETTGSFNTLASANNKDMGLMSGAAGVGYMLINILQHGNGDDILRIQLPTPPAQVPGAYTNTAVADMLFGQYYRRTFHLLKDRNINCTTLSLSDYQRHLDALMNDPFIRQVYEYETQLCERWKIHKGYLPYYKLNDYLLHNKPVPLTAATSSWCRLSDHVRIVATSFHPFTLEKEDTVFILQELTPEGVLEKVIGRLPGMMLQQASEHTTPAGLVNAVAEQVNVENEAMVKEKIWQQLAGLGEAGFILFG